MAQRRMFSKNITSSARFLKMPQEAQNLYFHLCMNADDDGIVEAFTIMQMLGSAEDNIRILSAKNLVKALNEDMVSYIMDWNEHNLIRADRKVNSIYKDLLLQILPEAKVKEPKPRADTGVITRRTSTGRPLDRIGKDRIGKDRIKKIAEAKAPAVDLGKEDLIISMTLEEFVKKMRESPLRHINIIGEYADQIKPSFTTKDQWKVFINRNVRAANELSPFTDDQIKHAYTKLEENVKSDKNPKGYITKWTLETLLKFIQE